MNNRFAIVFAALVIVFGAIFVLTKEKADAPTGGKGPAQASNHVLGDNKKGVTLVEYGDFQCPACTAYHPLVKAVIEKYKSDISFQFVSFPLTSIHQNAMAAHRAAEAANMQGKYWEMHDLLYTNSQAWSRASNTTTVFESFAQQLGLDVPKFKQDAASSTVNGIINADLAKGKKLNISSTPTFFLNGKKIDQPPQSVEEFNKLIDNALAAKQPAS
jgi:protein-disulfide isomerase